MHSSDLLLARILLQSAHAYRCDARNADQPWVFAPRLSRETATLRAELCEQRAKEILEHA